MVNIQSIKNETNDSDKESVNEEVLVGKTKINDSPIKSKEEEAIIRLERDNFATGFDLDTINGETAKLLDLRGEKMLLNF